MSQVKSILKGKSTGHDEPVSATIVMTNDMPADMIRSTLQILNKLMRREQLTENDKASLCRVHEVNEILKMYKTNPKEAGAEMDKYREQLSIKLKSLSHHQQPSTSDTLAGQKRVDVVTDAPEAKKPRKADHEAKPTVEEPLIEEEPELPQGTVLCSAPKSLPPNNFNSDWLTHFSRQMCSKVPFYRDPSKALKPADRLIVESAEEQSIFVDAISPDQIKLLLHFIFDLQQHIIDQRNSGVADFTVPNKLSALHRMGDPLESKLLDSWYFTIPCHCATCSLRFASRKLLTAHHDYHFIKNASILRRHKGLDVAFRGWMESPQDFLGNRAVVITRNFFRNLDAQKNDDQKHFEQNLKESNETDFLENCVPADEVKCVCYECGESFEREWIGEPINLAVFRNVICLPMLGTEPVVFRFGESKDFEPLTGERPVDASNAMSDRRIQNSLYLHKSCYESNKLLRNKKYQTALVTEAAGEHKQLREPVALVEEQLDEDQVMTSAEETHKPRSRPRKLF